MKGNRSVLECPECEKPLVNIGSKVERIHPVACFIRDRYVTVIVGWCFIVYVVLGALSRSGWGTGRGGGIIVLALGGIPVLVNFVLLRLFPIYRITDCPYCGFHEKQRLGLSESGEL